MQMTGRGVALALAVALVAGFLIGYVPGCTRAGDLQARLQRADQASAFAAVRDLGSMLHIELANRNFGNAANLSARFFDQVRILSQQTNDPQTRERLQQILAEREAISSGLAQNDPGIEPRIRSIVQQLLQVGPNALPGN